MLWPGTRRSDRPVFGSDPEVEVSRHLCRVRVTEVEVSSHLFSRVHVTRTAEEKEERWLGATGSVRPKWGLNANATSWRGFKF
jgi:hypothetical protein